MVVAELTEGPSPLPPELRELYPFRHRYLQLPEGERLHYIDEGRGQPVLMLHGNPSWSFMYRNAVKALVEAGFRCIVPDHVGMGLSDKPQHYPYVLERHIRNIRILLETLGVESHHLIAHDWGGAIGMGVATARPQSIGKIVLMNTAAFQGPMPRRINVCRIPGFGSLAIRGFNAFAGGATHMAVSKRMPRLVRNGYTFPYDSWKNRVATLRFVQDIPLSGGEHSFETLHAIEERLQHLSDHRILLAWGMRDWCFCPPFFERWRQIYPAATCAAYADASHYLLEDARDRVIPEIKRFLQGAPASLVERGY